MSTPTSPAWRRAFDEAERRITPVVVDVLRSDEFALLLDRVARSRQGAERAGQQLTRTLLHAVNLPVATDVARLLAEVGRLQTETHRLGDQLSALQRRLEADGPPRAALPPPGEPDA